MQEVVFLPILLCEQGSWANMQLGHVARTTATTSGHLQCGEHWAAGLTWFISVFLVTLRWETGELEWAGDLLLVFPRRNTVEEGRAAAHSETLQMAQS